MKQLCLILFIPGIILWTLSSVNLSDGHKICVEQLDLVVILDTSKSVGVNNFKKCIVFLERLVANLSIAPDSVRVALLRYSDNAQVVSYLNQDMEKQEKVKAVASIQYIEGSTYTDLALELTNEEVLSPERGDRSNVSDLVLLITDGESSNKPSTDDQGVKLKNRNNLKIFTLGIGSEIDEDELQAIATSPDFSMIVDSFENLADIITPMTTVTCSGGSILDPTEQTTESSDQTTHLSEHTTQLNYSATYSSAWTTHLSDQTTHSSNSTTQSRTQTTQIGDQNRPTDQSTLQIKYPTIQSNAQTIQLNAKTQTLHSSESTTHSNKKLARSSDQTTYSSDSTTRPSASRDQRRQSSYLITRQKYSNPPSSGLTTQSSGLTTNSSGLTTPSYHQTTKSRKRTPYPKIPIKHSNDQTTDSNNLRTHPIKQTTYSLNQTKQTRRNVFLNTQSIDWATQTSSLTTQSRVLTTQSSSLATKSSSPTTQSSSPTTQSSTPTTQSSALTTQSSALTTQSSALTTQSSSLTTHSNIQTTKPSNLMTYSTKYWKPSNDYTRSSDYVTHSKDQKAYLSSQTTRLADHAIHSSSPRTLAGGRSRKLDLIIILHASVREDLFMATINFTETLLEELPISSDLVRVALGYQSNQVQIASDLNASTNKEEKLKEVLRIKELTMSQTLNKSSQITQLGVLEGDRSDVDDIIMYITSDVSISSNLTINETKIYSIGVLNVSNWLNASNLSNVSLSVDSFTSSKDVADYVMTTSTSGTTTRRYLVVTVHQRTSFQNVEVELSDQPVGDVNNETFLTYLGIAIAIIVASLAMVVAIATLYRKKQNQKNMSTSP